MQKQLSDKNRGRRSTGRGRGSTGGGRGSGRGGSTGGVRGSGRAGSAGGSRAGRGRRRNTSGDPRRSLAAVLLFTLFAAFLIFTEPGKEIISFSAGTQEAAAAVTADGSGAESQGTAEQQPAAELQDAAEHEDTEEQPGSSQSAQAVSSSSEQQPSQGHKAELDHETPQPDIDVHRDSSSEALFTMDMVPAYSGQAYADINGDVPFFTEEEMTKEAFHEYWPLDGLGRCTGAFACVGPETLPKEKRGDISEVKPTGWHRSEYSDIDGGLLFNRCHLIGHMLTGQDANERNLITGTRYMNTEGMLPFEESVLMYVEGTGHHVLYRVRPFYEGQNLVASGVLMEARSVEDPLVQFCAFCYNVQPGFEIDYATGDNRRAKEGQDEEVQRIIPEDTDEEESGNRSAADENGEAAEAVEKQKDAGTRNDADAAAENGAEASEEAGEDFHYVLNTNTHKFHMPYCDSVNDIKDKNKKISEEDRDTLIRKGYSPCGRCKP